jgi:signal transduction histidine kinase/DNA-binding response OmpR family regulator
MRWVRARSFPIDGTGGVTARYVCLIQDVTDQREMEMELRQAQKMEAVGALASGVAHDFNNVLQGVLGCITLAQRPGTSPEQLRAFLEQAADAARRGGGLSARLMSFAHKRVLDAASTVIDAMITRSAPLLERLLTEQVVLELQLEAGDATVRADAVQIEQILLNLAANARDAMPGGGRLQIRTETVAKGELPAGLELRQAERYVRLQVRDYGLGMDEATKVRIFEPFFTTKQPGTGTGLGLSTVFSVARQLGGHVDAQSEIDRGSTFTIHLPCCEPPAAADVLQVHELPRLQGVVLLVEDEPVVRLTVRHHLDEMGVEVLEAGDAFEAQRVLRRFGGKIDLLMSDVVLPGMRGTVLAENVQRQQPELRVLFMTANPELLDHDPDGKLGAPVLRKPFGREELARQLLALLPQAQRGRAPEPPGATGPDRRPPSPSHAGSPQQSAVVLLVDDDDGSRAALSTLLEDRGYRVLSAAGPTVALALAHEHSIDLLLTDVAMPEMPGDVLAGQVRALHPKAGVVLMSGMEVNPEPRCSFLLKPFDFDTLLSLLTLELHRTRPESKEGAGGTRPTGNRSPPSLPAR